MINMVSKINKAIKNPEEIVKLAEKQYKKEIYSAAKQLRIMIILKL